MKLEFENIESDLAVTLWRTPVPGGWLMLATEEVQHIIQGRIEGGWDWRTSAVFIPDPNHTWR